jgi:hypothetical protein
MNHISLNFGESTGLLKLDVESLGFIGQAPNFACQGSALGLAIGGRSRLQETESYDDDGAKARTSKDGARLGAQNHRQARFGKGV